MKLLLLSVYDSNVNINKCYTLLYVYKVESCNGYLLYKKGCLHF